MSAASAVKIKKQLPTLLWGAAAIAFLFLVIKNSALSASLTLSALELCAKTLVPALFPSAVAARVLSSGGALLTLSAPLDRPANAVFGLTGEALAVSVTGIICGFPTGAVGAVSLYEKGAINNGQLLRALTLSGTPSLPFLVFAVGERGFGDRSFGFFLFFATLFSSAAVTSLLALFERIQGKEKTYEKQEKKTPKNTESSPLGMDKLTAAVSASALDILRVCAFVIFFSVAAGLAEHILTPLSLSPYALLPLGCLEITGGMTRAAASARGGRIAAAFFSGFGGLSASAQVGAIVSQSKISLGKYILLRLLIGAVSATAAAVRFGV